ncbi:MAG: hypothetical protein EOO22_02355 [Comamonadaceae bacterium]|nr:MAG: hypothetical protein EOO22_02355 [Comamonadaceae bacterium]
MHITSRRRAFSSGRRARHPFEQHKVLAAATLALCCVAGHAAQIDPGDLARLTQLAQHRGAVRVMVSFDVGASLDALAKRPAAVRAASAQKADALLAELGADAWEAGRWRNGLGQIGLYVTPAGLQRLAATSNAKSFGADPTSHYRTRGNEADGSHRAIEAALERNGEVDIEVVLETDEGEPEIEQSGKARFKPSKALNDELQARLARINQKPWARRLRHVDGGALGESASFKARVDREAFAALRDSDEVRAVRPVGFTDVRPSSWSSAALDEARAKGSAEVIVTLRGAQTFSPKSGFMSAKAWKAQGRAHSRLLGDLLGPDGDQEVQRLTDNQAALGSVSMRLSAKALERLYAQKDPRILELSLNQPIARTALNNSTALINMPAAWNAGYRASGQSIVVVDTGIRKDHAFFRHADGRSKVTVEACFGTNSGRWVSYCPSANALGDSPLGLANSGEPVSDPRVCALPNVDCGHGTAVAGVAAGRAHPTVFGGLIQGVAPEANLISAQVYSYDPTNGGQTLFSTDLLAALQALFDATKPGLDNPYVVNMSLAGFFSKSSCPDAWPGAANMILNLVSRGVPVVAGTGNNGYHDMIGAPACIPHTVKVSAVNNDFIGATRAPYANVADPENFIGPFIFAPGGHGQTDAVLTADVSSATAVANTAGTSIAVPHVAGVYAAIKAAVPGISVADATAWLMSTGSVDIAVTRPAPFGTRMFRRVRMPNF